MAQGGEYAAPLTGEMIQSVQLQDLDGDGRQEAIAFFRMSSEEKPLKIYIFRQEPPSTVWIMCSWMTSPSRK